METLLGEVERALAMRLYYLASLLTLQLPDVCAALESPDGKTKPELYKAWYRTWLAPKYNRITEDDIYCLRSGVIHQGRFGHPGSQFSRVFFTLPDPSRNIFHNNVVGDALNLDLMIFCRDVIESVRTWHNAKKSDPTVQSNLQRLVQYYPNGMPPYIVGVPVIG